MTMPSDDATAVATELHEIAASLQRLGTAGAATPQGAIEVLSGSVERLADKVDLCAEGLHHIATAIEGHGPEL